MLTYGTLDAGFEIYECPNFFKSHIICYTCKSRFCSSCGVKYAKERSANVAKTCLNVKHRHVVFTIDEHLRDIFFCVRNRLHLLFEAAKQTLFYIFNRNNGNDAVVNYILRYTGRPIMAQSRILHYDARNQSIHYYYEDHETNESIEVKEHVFDFIKKLFIHVPESQFKMIRYCGIYATCCHPHKNTVTH